MTATGPCNHRTRVGQQRRERTRSRLIQAATLVFAERGPEAAQIDHIIQQAGVSRGTFYNYFQSTDELLIEAKNALAEEMVIMVSEASDPSAPHAQRLAAGLKAFIDLVQAHPLLLEFITRLGVRNFDDGGIIVPAPSDDGLSGAINKDVASALSSRMASDILQASTLTTLLRLVAGEQIDIPAFVSTMLRMLGHPTVEAAQIANCPYTPVEVPADSLITRSETARRSGRASQPS
ncbi:transcriptional regulator BetI [Thalassovita gelatinovora]|uniref:Transcriptional regulator BetI n=1 Tax=Thalassovita gelatinovora TaxID=53501 RepID=A0A0P1F8T3_THAGE|nr:TetR/AcrR family transcriptional regulator [Thalassovita gelatinovora]QIZ81311.1 TetR/AcrR family transcriptional regulator [Thalassovita gelatinovora]CUH64526.1 transcriptional regulator BetI [Thalassovita gelatinovora]SEP96896.1 transcriptional regulator, TetR family [Thalassovita gelatinovora]